MTDATGTTSYAYDAGDQLTTITPPSGGSSTYAYDGNGNETTAGSWSYGFNLANQLVSATSGTTSASYNYDGDGNRLSTTTAGATTDYLWDPNFAVPELSLEQDSSGGLLRRYLYGEGRISVTTPQTTAYFSVDNVGSPTALSDPAGASLGSFNRNPFGDGATSSGVDPSVADVPIGFTGELQDPVTQLTDLRARDYDATAGRFSSQDPFNDLAAPTSSTDVPSAGGYTYAGNDPLRFVDPTGLKYAKPCTAFLCLAWDTVKTRQVSCALVGASVVFGGVEVVTVTRELQEARSAAAVIAAGRSPYPYLVAGGLTLGGPFCFG